MMPFIGWIVVSFAIGYLIGDAAIRWDINREEHSRFKTVRELLDEIDQNTIVSDC